MNKTIESLEKDLEYCRKSLETTLKYWMGVGKKKMEAEELLKTIRSTMIGTDWYFSRIDKYFSKDKE